MLEFHRSRIYFRNALDRTILAEKQYPGCSLLWRTLCILSTDLKRDRSSEVRMMMIRGKRDTSIKYVHEDILFFFSTDYYLGLIGRVLGLRGPPSLFPFHCNYQQAVCSKGKHDPASFHDATCTLARAHWPEESGSLRSLLPAFQHSLYLSRRYLEACVLKVSGPVKYREGSEGG